MNDVTENNTTVADKHSIVEKSITINAAPAQIWHVLTDTALFSKWLSDSALTIQTTWQVGSPITMDGTFLNHKQHIHGTVIAFDPLRRLSYNQWNRISRLPDRPENYDIVEFRLIPDGDQTQFIVTHSNLIALAAPEHSNFYWNGALYRVKQLVEQL